MGRIWISVDGPFNEHLIRDVGGLYLGLAAASAAATFSRTPDAGRVIGVAWTVFGLPHLIYHARHFAEMAPIDAVGNAFTLGSSLILGVVLMLPGPRARRRRVAAVARADRSRTMKIAVAGGTGLVGGLVVRAAEEQGHEVVGPGSQSRHGPGERNRLERRPRRHAD